MENIVKYTVECESVYGMILVLSTYVFFYLVVHYALPLLCNLVITMTRTICNTVKTYNSVHAKVEVDDVSIETDLNR